VSALTLRIERAGEDGQAGEVRLLLCDAEQILAETRKTIGESTDSVQADRLQAYLEDAIESSGADVPLAAKQTERRLILDGESLFRAVFDSGEARKIWNEVAPRLAETRIEISDSGRNGPDLPWELLREPAGGRWLAVEALDFVRAPQTRFSFSQMPPRQSNCLRVLTVLSPASTGGLRFESAYRALGDIRSDPRLVWRVLRPATLGQINTELVEADAAGEPYHVLHYEGAGFLCDFREKAHLPRVIRNAGRPRNESTTSGETGYLLLDQAAEDDRLRVVDASELGELLGETHTPIVVLSNRCRSEEASFEPNTPAAFADFSQNLVNGGVAGVLSLPFCLPVEGAVRFFSAFYDQLADGCSLSAAAREGRKHLLSDSSRESFDGVVEHFDWPAVRVYEPYPLKPIEPVGPVAGVVEELAGKPSRKVIGAMPGPPGSGRIARDTHVLGVDSQLSKGFAALLHGPGGCGKTQLVAEFSEWAGENGGIDGPTIYTHIESHKSLRSLLDELAGVFGPAMRANGISWEPMDEQKQLEAALLVLSQIPVLWIWDGFESVADPSEGDSPWSQEERQKLAGFLDIVPDTQARVLAVSRDEELWLGGTLNRIPSPAWSDRELNRLIASLARAGEFKLPEHGRSAISGFAAGNPLAARILTRLVVEKKLSAGTAVVELVRTIETEAAARPRIPGVPTNLSALLHYVVGHCLSDPELEIAALAHLFPRVLDMRVLERMANPHRSWGLKELHTRGAFKRALAGSQGSPLDRIIRFGFLERIGKQEYRIERTGAAAFSAALDLLRPAQRQPALSGRLTLFSMQKSPEPPSPARPQRKGAKSADGQQAEETPVDNEAVRRAVAAFVEALAELGAEVARAHDDGASEVVARLGPNEASLRRAVSQAQERAWRHSLTGLVAGLGALYEARGRLASWDQTLLEVTPAAVGEAGQPKEGRSRLWRTVVDQRIRLSVRRRGFPEALALQRGVVRWDEQQAAELESKSIEQLTSRQKALVLTLAKSLNRLGSIARSDSQPNIETENRAIALCEQLGDCRRAADWAYDLGVSYTEVRAIRDLARAEKWLKRALDLLPDGDAARARFLASLGQVGWERFRFARSGERPESELIRHLTDARRYYEQAIEHDDPKDYARLAQHHLQFAHVSYSLGDIERAVPHYCDAIRLNQAQGSGLSAARIRFNLAIALRDVGRLGEARKYAAAAFGELRAFNGPVSEGLLDRSRRLVMHIEQKLQEKQDRRSRRVAHHAW